MPADIVPGTPAGSMTPADSGSLADALARTGRGGPVLIEAWPSGDRVQVHLVDGEVAVFGEHSADPLDFAAEVAAAVHARDAVLEAAVVAGRVTFLDLLLLDGESWAGRPALERLDRLGEVVPAASMLERAEVADVAWAEAFAEHARARGYAGVACRRPDAPWSAGPAGDAWVSVPFS